MAPETKRQRKPAITMTRSDHERLSRLADSYAGRNQDVADALQAELDRARVVADDRIAAGVVRMGSALRFTSDLGENKQVTLVYPGEADIADGRISILTPIGAALIGLSAGQSINWTARDGRTHLLTVESVDAPAGAAAASTAPEMRPAS